MVANLLTWIKLRIFLVGDSFYGFSGYGLDYLGSEEVSHSINDGDKFSGLPFM